MLLEEGVCYDQCVLFANSVGLCPVLFCTPRPHMSEEAEQFYEGPTGPSRTNTQKRCPFHYRRLDAKVGSQEIPK